MLGGEGSGGVFETCGQRRGVFLDLFDFDENGETLAWMHQVLYYPMEAFEVKMMYHYFEEYKVMHVLFSKGEL